VLVTGAGGFIGSHVAEALATSGAPVRAFVRYTSRNDHGWLETLPEDVRSSIEIFRGDLVNPEAVANAVAGVDTILHLGALIPIPYSYIHAREFVDTNVTGTLNVLEAARRAEVRRLVHTSSSEVYGTPVETPIAESHRLNAQSPYAATKVAADQLALSYHAAHGAPVVIVRPFNTFGPRQSARAVIPTIITQALSGSEIRLGNTSTTRDFTYVTDTARGLIAAAAAPADVEGSVLNLGTGEEVSVAAVAELVSELAAREIEIVLDEERRRPDASEVQRLVADTARARQLLRWEPAVSLRDGLRLTIEWFETSLDAYKPFVYNV
jgi:dTDP-glucose 4,6-dehydratase